MAKSQLGKIIRKLLIFALLLVAIFYWGQIYYKVNLLQLAGKYLNQYLPQLDNLLLGQLITGITIGTVLFIIILLIIPLLIRSINTQSYFKNLNQCMVSSFIFYISQLVYDYLGKVNRVYLLISIGVVVIVTIVLIQATARMYKNPKDGVEFRTGFVASITAGLIFSLLLKLFLIGFEVLKMKLMKPM